jgi:hypothetical protein
MAQIACPHVRTHILSARGLILTLEVESMANVRFRPIADIVGIEPDSVGLMLKPFDLCQRPAAADFDLCELCESALQGVPLTASVIMQTISAEPSRRL